MKSAGNDARNRSSCSNGAWCCADGIEPESNQASSTGASRLEADPQPSIGQSKVTSSTAGRCRSSSLRSRLVNPSSSATEPMHVSCPWAQRQTGSGVPQYRSRERAQSTLPSSHLPKRPYLMCSGCQPMPSFSRSRSSRRADVRTNHEVLAQYRSGVPQRQQWG
jgi:hypothetical protein